MLSSLLMQGPATLLIMCAVHPVILASSPCSYFKQSIVSLENRKIDNDHHSVEASFLSVDINMCTYV